MAKDRDIKYADYEYGQPESEKNGLLIRNKGGDNRLTLYVLGAFATIMLIGGIFAIPGVRDYFEGRKNLAEIAFGVEYVDLNNCFSRSLRLDDLHAETPLDQAKSIDVTVVMLTRSKGEVTRQTKRIGLNGIDWANPPSPNVTINPVAFQEGQNASVPTQCQVQIEINE